MKVARLGIVAILCVALGGLALAAEKTYEVSFVDGNGNLITDANLWVANTSGSTHSRHLGEADGVYEIRAEHGQKLYFELGINGANIAEAMMPIQGDSVQVVVAAPDVPPPGLQPPNDLCADAIGPLAVPSLTPGTTSGAGTDLDAAPGCGSGTVTSPGVWYTVIGTGNTMTITTCENQVPPGSANYDTKITVYTGGCDALVCLDGNDDELGCNFHSTLTFCSVFGEVYYVLVHGWGGASGDFDLSIFDDGISCATGACCSCDAAPFNCVDVRAADCDALGRQYAGDYVECFPLLGIPTRYESGDLFLPFGFYPTIVSDTISVPDTYVIGDVNIELEIFHTWGSDMAITVEHNGVPNNIWDNRCAGMVGFYGTADDSGDVTLCAVLAAGPANAVFYAEPVASQAPDLDVYEGMDVFGDWTLTIEDTFPYLDDGTLIRWAVVTDQQGPPACMDVNGPNCFLCGATGDHDTDDLHDHDEDHFDHDTDDDSDNRYKEASERQDQLGFGLR